MRFSLSIRYRCRLNASFFVFGTQAAGTDLDALRLSVPEDSRLLNIGAPSPAGVPLRMADGETRLTGFIANSALSHVL